MRISDIPKRQMILSLQSNIVQNSKWIHPSCFGRISWLNQELGAEVERLRRTNDALCQQVLGPDGEAGVAKEGQNI